MPVNRASSHNRLVAGQATDQEIQWPIVGGQFLVAIGTWANDSVRPLEMHVSFICCPSQQRQTVDS